MARVIKIFVVVMNLLMCLFNSTHAMELVLNSSEQEEQKKFLSIFRNRFGLGEQNVSVKSTKSEREIYIQAWICEEEGKRLPMEIKELILNNIEKLKLGAKIYDELKTIKRVGPINIGNKELSVIELWRLPREKINKVNNRLASSGYLSGRPAEVFLSQEEADEIIEILPEIERQGLTIQVADSLYSHWAFRHHPKIIAALVISSGIGLGIGGLVELDSAMGGVGAGLCILGSVGGIILQKCVLNGMKTDAQVVNY